MTYHRDPYLLQCHYCLDRKPLPQACPECEHQGLSTIGLGTQRLEDAISEEFPAFPVLRVDRDSVSNQDELDKVLGFIKSGKPAVMIGTQLLAKGHHFPNVTLVGIIDADSALYSSEFRAIENMGQLITQVAGRAGRAEKPGQVILQTYHPTNPHLQTLIDKGYIALCETILKERESAHLPPFASLAVIRAEAMTQPKVFDFLRRLIATCKKVDAVEVIGPLPLNRPKRAGYFRGEIIFRSHSKAKLQSYLADMVPRVRTAAKSDMRWHIEVDPINLLS